MITDGEFRLRVEYAIIVSMITDGEFRLRVESRVPRFLSHPLP